LARQVRTLLPRLPVILMSGYNDAVPATGHEFRLLRKPIPYEDLYDVVRNCWRRQPIRPIRTHVRHATCRLTPKAYVGHMRKHPRATPFDLPVMLAQLTIASWETIWHRSLMMAQGTCTAARISAHDGRKARGGMASMTALTMGRSHAAVLAPFVTRTRANARGCAARPSRHGASPTLQWFNSD